METDRITVFECDQFCIELEYNSEYVIWHTRDVKNFNRAAFRRMREFSDQLERFLSLHYTVIYTAMDPARKDLAKLAMHGGFKPFAHSEGLDVYRKPLARS